MDRKCVLVRNISFDKIHVHVHVCTRLMPRRMETRVVCQITAGCGGQLIDAAPTL